MKPVEIIFEPVPVARIGIRKDDGVVFTGIDYSCFAHMLEEYISVGTTRIAIPKSSPEAKAILDAPHLISRCLRIIDDDNENEATARLLYGLRKEFSVELTEEGNRLNFPHQLKSIETAVPKTIDERAHLEQAIRIIHRDVKRLALGFNHGVAIDFNTEASLKIMRFIRKKTQDAEVRALIAQLEGIISPYVPVSFGAAIPKDNAPTQLISLFDRLLNDPNYLTFSNNVSLLSSPETRATALVEIRSYARFVSSRKIFGTSWDYATRLLKIWPGLQLPESKDIAAFTNGREFPTIVNMSEARDRAVEHWRAFSQSTAPLGRDGNRLRDEAIEWLPPAASVKAGGTHSAPTFGTVGELLIQLQEYESRLKAAK